MNLEMVKASAEHHGAKNCDNCPHKHEMQAKGEYHCPMHPEVTGKKGDTCPKCGMNLEPVKSAKSAEHKAQHHQH
ncbi:heavy metal-binding domain-containing protein [Shewanella sp. AS1]|uniref:heavy metal-binding domain-containing protein n=1 Tax=Shewanella sp. AS1 TaxID=2907626 RepID=UPI003FA34D0D